MSSTTLTLPHAVFILPTYNEAESIGILIEQLRKVFAKLPNYRFSILVVDDNSPDGTAKVVAKLSQQYANIKLLTGEKKGLGAAYVRGMHYANSTMHANILFEIDSDLSHDPKVIPQFLHEINKGAEYVVGSRYIKGGSIPENWAWQRKLYSLLGNLIVRYGLMIPKVREWSSGYRAMKSYVFNAIEPGLAAYSGYTFQIASLHRVIKAGYAVSEIPISFTDRKYGKSKFEVLEYAPNVLKYILLNSSFIKFVITGFTGAAIDFGIAALLIHYLGMFKPTANTISAEFSIISNFLLNNFWSFKHKKITGGLIDYLKKFLFFNLVASGALALQWVGMYSALQFFGDRTFQIGIAVSSWIVYKIVIIGLFVIPYSFFMYNRFIWVNRNTTHTTTP